MSLRLRFTLIVTTLLAAVLVGAGWVVAEVEQRQADAEVERRLRHAVRTAYAFTAEPLLRERSGPRPPGIAPLWLEPVRGALEPEPDGAHFEAFFFLVPRVPDGPEPALIAHTYTGEVRLDIERDALTPARIRGPTPLEQASCEGQHYLVLSEQVVGDRGPGLPPRPGPPARGLDRPPFERPPTLFPPGPPVREGNRHAPRPPGPPSGPRIMGVGFLEQGPALSGLHTRLRTLALIGVGALLLGGVLAWLLSGHALRPVREAARAAEAIECPEQRLPQPVSRDELGRLVDVLNGMLGRLEQGSRRERTFLATASHELRRPLAALTGELELARRGERKAEDLRAAVDLALGDAVALARLVDDLLYHARARAGALTPRMADVDLVDVLAEAVGRSRRVLPATASIRLGDMPPATLRGDAVLLGQVFENLMVNAGTHGGRDTAIEVRAEVTDGSVHIHVEDDGLGIAPADLPHVFEPFGRGDRARGGSGTGLGLAIAKDVVEAHGGAIRVTSPLRKHDGDPRGTRVTVSLPRSTPPPTGTA